MKTKPAIKRMAFSKLGMYFQAITKLEKAMRLIAGLVFILTGLYYINIYFKILWSIEGLGLQFL